MDGGDGAGGSAAGFGGVEEARVISPVKLTLKNPTYPVNAIFPRRRYTSSSLDMFYATKAGWRGETTRGRWDTYVFCTNFVVDHSQKINI